MFPYHFVWMILPRKTIHVRKNRGKYFLWLGFMCSEWNYGTESSLEGIVWFLIQLPTLDCTVLKVLTRPFARPRGPAASCSWTSCSLAWWWAQWPLPTHASPAGSGKGCARTSPLAHSCSSPWSSNWSPRRPRWCGVVETCGAPCTCPPRPVDVLAASPLPRSAPSATALAAWGGCAARTGATPVSCTSPWSCLCERPPWP